MLSLKSTTPSKISQPYLSVCDISTCQGMFMPNFKFWAVKIALDFVELFGISIPKHVCISILKNIFSDSLIWLCETKIRRETLQASVRSVISHIHFGGCGWLHHDWTWRLESRDWVDSIYPKDKSLWLFLEENNNLKVKKSSYRTLFWLESVSNEYHFRSKSTSELH